MKKIIGHTNPTVKRDFSPAEGGWWLVGKAPEYLDLYYVELIIAGELSSENGFAVEVKAFHNDGRAITGDCPSEGTFIATRL